jgi:hypothetical protein
MNHRHIEEHHIIDRYVMGDLTVEEQTLFAGHFMDCADCLDQLELADRFHQGLKMAVAQRAVHAHTQVQTGVLGWLAHRNRRRMVWMAAGLLLLAVLPALFLVNELRRTRQELARVTDASAHWQTQHNQQQHTVQTLENDIQMVRQQVAQQQQQLEAQRQQEQRTPTEPARFAPSTRPQINTPIFALSIMRSADPGQPAQPETIVLPRSPQWIVLSLESEDDPMYAGYRAALQTADGRVVWKQDQLRPNQQGDFAVSFHSTFFRETDYRLLLEGRTPDGQFTPAARYVFRVLKEDSSK